MTCKRVITPETLEPYLILCSEILDECGDDMQPWLDRMESEYETAKKKRHAVKQVSIGSRRSWPPIRSLRSRSANARLRKTSG